MALPTITVETAGGNALSVPGSWTDITADVLGTVSVSRGRSRLLDEAQAGSGALELNNSTRKWDPTNALGPYNPLQVWRKFRIKATFNAVTYPLMYGFALSYRVNWDAHDGPNFSRATIPLSDGIALLAQQEYSATLSQQEYGARISTVLDYARWPTAWRSGTGATGYDVSAGKDAHKKAWDGIREAVVTAGVDPGRVVVDGSGNLAVDPGVVTGYSFGPASLGYLPYQAAAVELSDDLIYNDVSVTRHGGTAMRAYDNASINKYGRKVYSRETLNTWPDQYDAQSLANDILAAWKEPKVRPDGFTVRPGGNSALWTAVLDIEVGDKFTMIAAPPGAGTPFNKTMKVLGLRHTFSANLGNWTTQYNLVEV